MRPDWNERMMEPSSGGATQVVRELSDRILREVKATLPVEVKDCYEDLLRWIDAILESHGHVARPVTEFSFDRLPAYYPGETLRTSKVFVVERCPGIPLGQFGLSDGDLPPPSDTAGFALRNNYFVASSSARDESTHFHELVHVVQWQLLGDECFFNLYAKGLLTAGYRSSPLEVIAYDLQERFDSRTSDFDVVPEVHRALSELSLI